MLSAEQEVQAETLCELILAAWQQRISTFEALFPAFVREPLFQGLVEDLAFEAATIAVEQYGL